MGCMRCCGGFALLLAVLIGSFIYFGRQMDISRGTMPLLLNEVNLKAEDIHDLSGKTIVVTGANTGLGKSSVKLLAGNGAKVIMACRSMQKCLAAKDQIIQEISDDSAENPNLLYSERFKQANLVPMYLDLGSFQNIKKFAENYMKRFNKLDSLMLNAGVMHPPFGLTADGLESQIGINHVTINPCLFSLIKYALF